MQGLIAVTIFVIACLMMTGWIGYIGRVWRGVPQLFVFILYLMGGSGLLLCYASTNHINHDKRRAYWLLTLGLILLLVAVYTIESWFIPRG